MKNKEQIKEWKIKNKLKLQNLSFLIAIIAPFGLYFALENSLNILAVVLFTVIALCMLLIAWIS